MERKQFTFYRSFWDACLALPQKDRLAFLTAVCSYAFEETDEVDLTGGAGAAFAIVRPILDSSRKKAESGSYGGSKPKANASKPKANASKRKANESKRKANESSGKQSEASRKQEQEQEQGQGQEQDKDKGQVSLPPSPLPGGEGLGGALGSILEAALEDWRRYKAERGQPYTATGLEALRGQAAQEAGKHGAEAVASVILESMANGYAGIAWSRLETKADKAKPQGTPGEDLSWMKPYL